ncbi:PucR family transcriptional regulator [Austwickia chelonae]|uniref:PucR family transcriptional regulator n=1 Tax=Austwickia chelonae TaxID=100225 RepID=UPI000E22E05D|nr:helix-turn-helix domain-containing protein [Austwickia chelonae]
MKSGESEHADWQLDRVSYDRMRGALAEVADAAVATIIDEVPSYAGPFTGPRGQRIREAVRLALDVFLTVSLRAEDVARAEAESSRITVRAYDLGRGEARAGRPMDALLAAYRIGAGVSWRFLSREAIASGMPAAQVGQFAERVFSYIDDLSAASVTGHTDELETRGRARERLLERLARALAAGEPEEELRRRADRAGWDPPLTLTAVLLPTDEAAMVRTGQDPRTLSVTGELPGLDDDLTLLFIPEVGPSDRLVLRRRLSGRHAVIGPTRPWASAMASLARARRACPQPGPTPYDTEQHLVELVVSSDQEALTDLRAQVLAPLAGLRPAVRARLEDTLRSWLARQGRREAMAADLFVHPQTVRYRMGQLRQLYGESLDDPATTTALTVALAVRPGPGVVSC